MSGTGKWEIIRDGGPGRYYVLKAPDGVIIRQLGGFTWRRARFIADACNEKAARKAQP